MKRFVIISVILILFVATIVSSVFAIKYKKQTQKLNTEITSLNTIISNMSDENKKLTTDKDFAEKQYEDFKSSKSNKEPIHVEVQECMKACNYTTECMNDCIYASEGKWEKEIDKNIKQLEKILNKEQKELLHDSQVKWLAYKNAQQKLNSETIGTMMGSMYTNILAGEQVYLIELRAKELDGLYYLYSKK